VSYWEQDPRENMFMEVTDRRDIGTNLWAPRLGRGGKLTGSYSLVPAVSPGVVIVHYDNRDRHKIIVGVSIAAGAPEPASIHWAARGKTARQAGVKPSWLTGLVRMLTASLGEHPRAACLRQLDAVPHLQTAGSPVPRPTYGKMRHP
jgi:hypothetical protein